MGFLYRLAFAALLSMTITGFTLVAFGTPVSPQCFYGSMAAGVALSYLADALALARASRELRRRGF